MNHRVGGWWTPDSCGPRLSTRDDLRRALTVVRDGVAAVEGGRLRVFTGPTHTLFRRVLGHGEGDARNGKRYVFEESCSIAAI
ncbi:hypothetical protein E2C01_097881 [Portunus trituberculatus]|uniref:Uncharacterized protein n=1 Tax=Portunus trituberculatus TaxID=210409 RepID=A0A5B7KCJ1_PORTR|nr:hypothetical protein [Portunus trituberculatus]